MVNKDYRKNSSDRERKLSWSGLKERVSVGGGESKVCGGEFHR